MEQDLLREFLKVVEEAEIEWSKWSEAVIGAGRLQEPPPASEDSVKLNTSFVERLNLTIRKGSSYLGQRTICQAPA
jgi:hypothetical protein